MENNSNAAFCSENAFIESLICSRFFLGGSGERGTPEPIPNSEVKPFIADGTAHKSVEE